MRKISLVLAAAALMASSSLVPAAELKVGFVKLERLFKEAAPAVKAQKKIEKEFAARDLELQKLARQARDLQTQPRKRGRNHG